MKPISLDGKVASHDMDLATRLNLHSIYDKNGCKLWRLFLNERGYGHLLWNGKKRRVHRLAWENANGVVPKGMLVLHRCDVRHCINPNHLFLGTAADNSSDMKTKGRAARGHDHWNRKLTEEQIRQILAMRKLPWQAVAQCFGLRKQYIHKIWRREVWAHVEPLGEPGCLVPKELWP